MNTTLLKKDINNIVLSKSNSDINFFTTKKSFLDKNFTSLNDVFLEISKVCEQEYGISSEELYLSSKKKEQNNPAEAKTHNSHVTKNSKSITKTNKQPHKK